MIPAVRREDSAPELPQWAAWTFLAAFFFCHVAYPLWIPIDARPGEAIALYSLFVVLAAVLLRLLAPSLDKKSDTVRIGPWPRDPWLWSGIVLSTAIRAYPLTLPVHLWAAGDEAVHMGFPALPFKAWNRTLSVPLPALFWTIVLAAFALRRHWTPAIRRFVSGLAAGRVMVSTATVVGLAAYFLVVYRAITRMSSQGYPSLIRDLLRTPPLGKALHSFFYAAFGISDVSGRLPEFLFYCGSAVLIYRIADEHRSKTTARLAAMLYLFLPAVAYYSMRGSQTQGELFFYLLCAFFFARWLKEGAAGDFYWACVAVSLGSLYRYTVLPMVAVIGLATLSNWRRGLRQTAERGAVLVAAACLPWAASYLVFGLRPYGMGAHSFLEGLVEPALSVPRAVSWPIALLLLAGLLRAWLGRKDPLQRFLMLWFAVYYLFISRDLGWDVRLTLPMYPPLIIWAADLLAAAGRAAKLAGAVVLAYLLFIGLWAPVWPLKPEYTLRQSLRTQYLPLKSASSALAALPPGTRVLSVDCSRGCFSFYLLHPERIQWISADSSKIRSLDELIRLSGDARADVVLYASGTVEALGARKNPALFAAFAADNRDFSWRADERLGENNIAIKDVAKVAQQPSKRSSHSSKSASSR